MKSNKKIVVAITGASGSIYALNLINKLKELFAQISEVSIVFSNNAKDVWNYELPESPIESLPFKTFDRKDFYAPFASGSSKYDTMVICPCSMGTLGRIANGISDDLITRAADVMLKERRKLILVTRETPLSLIHINNMKAVTEAGGIICPANPSFYNKPITIDEVVDSVINRVIDLIGIENNSSKRWGDNL